MGQLLELPPYTIRLFAEGNSRDVVYCPLSTSEAEQVWQLLPPPKPVLVAISGIDWNRDLSPWPAPRAFRGGEDFGGGAPTFLADLTKRILPQTETELGFVPASRSIAGYSLAGLFTLWTLNRTVLFDRAASMSGSLWFDGFLSYLEDAPLLRIPERVYLSLGDREKGTKNSLMAVVEVCTRQAAELFRNTGIPVTLEWNPGGHFKEVPQRIARGISALYGPQA